MSEPLLDVFVPGVPKPAGSKNAVPVFNRHTRKFVTDSKGRPVIQVRDSAGEKGANWSSAIVGVVSQHWTQKPISEPVALNLAFTMPRPKYHFGSRRGEPYLKSDAPSWFASAPDTTKLVRRVEDALTSMGLWSDDCLVVEQSASKVYGERPGVRITVSRASSAKSASTGE